MAKSYAILISSPDDMKLWSALSLATAQAALGKSVAVFLSGHAASCARTTFVSPLDGRHAAQGVATIAELFAACADFQIEIHVCQTGMLLHDLVPESLRVGAVPGGLIDWLSRVKSPDATF